jgi:hypothetical protein
MAASRESIAFAKNTFVRFTNLNSFRSGEGRIRMARDAVGRDRDQACWKITRGLIVGRKDELADLITAFDRAVHEDHPNLERVGCPGRRALTTLAKESAIIPQDSILEHIRNCAACLDELKELRLAHKQEQ